MSLNSRRLYLSSLDSDRFYPDFDGKFSFNLTKAGITCPNNQMIAISLVRCELPATMGISTTVDDNSGSNPNVLVLNVEKTISGVTTGYNILFNVRTPTVGAGVKQFPLTLQNTIQDLIDFINIAIETEVLKLDDSAFGIGLFRLAVVDNTQSLKFKFETCTPCLLRALGLNTATDTIVDQFNSTPFNFDMAQYLPLIRLKSINLNMNSTSSFDEGDSNILEAVPTSMDNGNSFFEDRSQTTTSGTLIFKKKQTVVMENTYMSKQIIPTKRLDNLNIQLFSKDNQPITVGQQPCAFVIQVDYLDSL